MRASGRGKYSRFSSPQSVHIAHNIIKSNIYALFNIERFIPTKLSSILVPAFVLFVLFTFNSSSNTSHWSTIAEATSGATFFSWKDDKKREQCIAMSCSSAAKISEYKFVRSLAVPAFKE